MIQKHWIRVQVAFAAFYLVMLAVLFVWNLGDPLGYVCIGAGLLSCGLKAYSRMRKQKN